MKLFMLFAFLITSTFSQYSAVKTSKTLIIDGILEDEWNKALKIKKFNQYDPNFNIPATKATHAYFMYDEENIYVAAKIFQDRSTIKSNRYRRDTDELWSGDWFQVNIDPFNKGYSGYYIGINPSNAIIEGKIGSNGEDKSYDFIFHSEVQIREDHWSLEIQIPLNGIDFQNEDIQTWGLTFLRHYADNNERIASHRLIKEDMFRMSNYHKVSGLRGLKKANPFSFVPYQYYSEVNDKLNDKSSSDGKVGYELKYQPNSETTWMVTVNPDFAQIETDAEVINVSDQPTQYPEKRPFFTYNSDMYRPASAVRTRNIGDIDVGMKLIKEVGFLKYDLTAVLDKDQNRWLLGDLRYTDIENYSVEFIGGAKKTDNSYVSNGVLNTKLFFLNRTLSWWQYIEYASENDNKMGWLQGVQYRTREWNAQISHDMKHQDYLPRQIGVWLQSNQFNSNASIAKNFYFENSFFVSVRPKIEFERNALYSHKNEADTEYSFEIGGRVKPSEALGIWNLGIKVNPDNDQRFRYRGDKLVHKYYDTYSPFSLVKQGFTDVNFWWETDRSKVISLNGWGWSGSSRNAPTSQFQNTLTYRPNSNIALNYTINYIDVEGSFYTNQYIQTIHRIKLEYNVTDKLNIRGIFQLNESDENVLVYDLSKNFLNKTNYEEIDEPTFNLTASWEYEPGSFAFLVFNRYKKREILNNDPKQTKGDDFSVILKINKTFQF